MSRYEWASDCSEMAYANSKLGTDTVGIFFTYYSRAFARWQPIIATSTLDTDAVVPTRGQSTRATAMPIVGERSPKGRPPILYQSSAPKSRAYRPAIPRSFDSGIAFDRRPRYPNEVIGSYRLSFAAEDQQRTRA